MNNTSISIIVPVYKAESYLCRCIDSLLAQTFKDFEILLIDDGSPDRSGEICDQYANSDHRVKVFHKENGGVSSARQHGLDNATGEYVIHADPDDWVEPDMLKDMYEKALSEDADMVICNFYWDTSTISVIHRQQPSSLDSESVLLSLFQGIHGSCCNKLVKLSLFKKYGIGFYDGLSFCEDLMINVKLLKLPLKIAYLNQAYYHYVQNVNQNSLSRSYSYEVYNSDKALERTILNVTSGTIAESASKIYMQSMTVQRAFFAGFFSSSEFRKRFCSYRHSVIKTKSFNILVRIAIYLSCIGAYGIIYILVTILR